MLCRSLLELNLLADTEVLTICPLIKELKNVTFIDSPDGNEWIKEGDFVLTTGFFVSGSTDWEDKFFDFIRGIIERGGFGIGVKIGRHIPYLPEFVREYACENNFPIIQLDNQPAWADFLWEITNALSQAKDAQIHQLNTVYEKFHNHLKRKGDLEQLAAVLYNIIKKPLTIYLKKMNIRIDYPEYRDTQIDLDYLISASFYGIDNRIQAIKYNEEIITVKWINEKNTFEGGIFIWSNMLHLSSDSKIAIEQAAMIANLEVEQQNLIKSIEQRHINDFVIELLNKSFESVNQVQHKMDTLDLHMRSYYRLILLDIENHSEASMNNVISTIRSSIKIKDYDILVGENHDGRLVVLVPEEEFDETIAEIANLLGIYHSDAIVRCGMSRTYYILELHHALREAKIALTTENQKDHARKPFSMTCFSELNVERILFSESTLNEAEEIYKETLMKIVEYDAQYQSEFLETLYFYLESDLNVEKASEKLFIHKNTVRYRLKTIETILDISLGVLDNIVLLKIAFSHLHFKDETKKLLKL